MKITIVFPNGEQRSFNADFWEFSQNKFKDQDVVLFFFSKSQATKNVPKEDTPLDKSDKEILDKPSTKGVIELQEEVEESLDSIVSPQKIKELRDMYKITFTTVDSSNEEIIRTDNYSITQIGSIDKAVNELILRERDFIEKGYRMMILKSPVIKTIEKDLFYIEEVIKYDR